MRLPWITAYQFRQVHSLVRRVRLALSSPRNTVRGCHDGGPGGNYDPAAAKWAHAEHECKEILFGSFRPWRASTSRAGLGGAGAHDLSPDQGEP